MKKRNYLNNKDILSEIHKSKSTYCSFTDPSFHQYDGIISMFDEVSEHIEEFSQRLVFCLIFLLLATLVCFGDVKEIVRIFQAPAIGVKKKPNSDIFEGLYKAGHDFSSSIKVF